MDAVTSVEFDVRELIRRKGIDPVKDVLAARQLIQEAVAEYNERSMSGGLPQLPDLAEAVKAITDAVAGFGPLQQYFDDPAVEEVWINEPAKVRKTWHGMSSYDEVGEMPGWLMVVLMVAAILAAAWALFEPQFSAWVDATLG